MKTRFFAIWGWQSFAMGMAVLFGFSQCSGAIPHLVMRLAHPPSEEIAKTAQRLHKEKALEKIEKFGKIAPEKFVYKTVKGLIREQSTPGLSGVLTMYGGYFTHSDKEGIVEFPLRHEAPKVYLVITPRLKLARLGEETISHMHVPKPKVIESKNDKATELKHDADFLKIYEGEKAKFYTLEQKKDKSEVDFWEIKETPIPETRRISKLSLVILANPRNFFVRTGDFMRNTTDHMVLPPVYMIGKKYNDRVLLSHLRLTRYFEEVEMSTQKAKSGEKEIVQKAIANS
ncbi:hypothetical protein HOD08_03405 [bacterium]|nr:hypothetical protein [bacterium]